MGDEPITQNQKEEFKCNYIIEKKTDLKSYLLQELLNKVYYYIIIFLQCKYLFVSYCLILRKKNYGIKQNCL